MLIIEKISEMKKYINQAKLKGKTIGFVPTMGYLHSGHISLMEMSKKENDITIVSIFVNPTQFGPKEDFSKYPRDIEKDSRACENALVDVIFYPNADEMYPKNYQTFVEVLGLSENLCGKSRPSHFKGVTTVVLKLFNIIEPHKAYFGQKDAQQLTIIQKMVSDLNLSVEIVPCPIVREEDGLAKSSRNVYLNSEERKQATVLYKSLKYAKELIQNGEKNASIIKSEIEKIIGSANLASIDYIEIVDNNLKEVETINDKCLIALAVKFGSTRLIDNIIVDKFGG